MPTHAQLTAIATSLSLFLALDMPATEVAPSPPAVAAELVGRVKLPAPEGSPVVEQRYKLVIENGVARMSPPQAVVYLDGDFPTTEPPGQAEILQRDLAFHPQLLPIRVGTRVSFPNQDDTYHNVFSFSPTKRFDLGRYRAEDPVVPSQTFDQVGLVTLRCDIHEHMRAAILVLNTPHFAVTSPDGSFRLPNEPPGRHTLKVWLDSRTTREIPIEVAPGQTQHVELP